MKNKKLFMIMAVSLVILFLSIIAYGNWANQKNPIRVVYLPKVEDNSDFWASMREGVKMAAKDFDVELTIMSPRSENDYERQRTYIHEAIAMNPSAIIVVPCSYTELTEDIRKIAASGIKLVMLDSSIDEQLAQTCVATDNYQAGISMGEFLAERIPENPVIGVVAHVKGSSTATERENGLRKGLGAYEKNIVDLVFSESDYDIGHRVTKEMLEENPDINVIAGLNEYSAVGAARAVKELGLQGRILMVGFDSSMEEVKLLEEGVFQGIIIQKPFNMGYLGVQKTMDLLWGRSVDPTVDSGFELITSENMYTEENQKLLFPFWGN